MIELEFRKVEYDEIFTNNHDYKSLIRDSGKLSEIIV